MKIQKSILCIVPLPPPITGAALASETAVNSLKKHHKVTVIPYQRGNLISGRFSLRQFFRVICIGIQLRLMEKRFDAVYLVISSTLWGNIRDLYFLIMMGRTLRAKAYLHLHGANIDRYFLSASSLVRAWNKNILRQVRRAIVLGETFKNIFDGYIANDHVKIIKNNFCKDLLIPGERLDMKYAVIDRVNVLFLSNLIREKGYMLLLDAFLGLPQAVSGRAMLHFAGELHSPEDKRAFFDKIGKRPNIVYHGPLKGEMKRKLLWDTHVFCLPTYYKYEGQPISIIEAYASGCIVLTTDNGGIKDIFADKINGFYTDIDINFNLDIEKIRTKLETVIVGIQEYKSMARFNREEAIKKYSEDIYCENIERMLIS